MKHVKTLNGATLKKSAAHGGCGECQTSCQSACKTSCQPEVREPVKTNLARKGWGIPPFLYAVIK